MDVCVVVNPPLTQPQAQAFGDVHDRMRELFIVQGLESWEPALIAQTEQDLAALRNWTASYRSSAWLAGMAHWAARCLIFWRDGKMLAKSAALRHEIDRGSAFADAFQLALMVRTEGRGAAEQYRTQLLRHLERSAGAWADQIERAVHER